MVSKCMNCWHPKRRTPVFQGKFRQSVEAVPRRKREKQGQLFKSDSGPSSPSATLPLKSHSIKPLRKHTASWPDMRCVIRFDFHHLKEAGFLRYTVRDGFFADGVDYTEHVKTQARPTGILIFLRFPKCSGFVLFTTHFRRPKTTDSKRRISLKQLIALMIFNAEANLRMVRVAGVEPTTFGFGGRHSIQLSYTRNLEENTQPRDPAQCVFRRLFAGTTGGGRRKCCPIQVLTLNLVLNLNPPNRSLRKRLSLRLSPDSEVGARQSTSGRLSSLPVRATFLSPVPRNTGLESPVYRQAGKPARRAQRRYGSPSTSEFGLRMGTVSGSSNHTRLPGG